jgi:rRNA maturation endonuclease Nob1
MEQNEILAYFTRAIQVNIIRETQYAYNSLKTDGVEIEEWDEDLDEMNLSQIDYQNILNDIETNFSIEWKTIFQLWTEGLTIQEINNKLNIQNSRYIVDKLKKWIKEKYDY